MSLSVFFDLPALELGVCNVKVGLGHSVPLVVALLSISVKYHLVQVKFSSHSPSEVAHFLERTGLKDLLSLIWA